MFKQGDQIRLNRKGIETYGADAPVAKYTATVKEQRGGVVILSWNEVGTGHSQSYNAGLFELAPQGAADR